jgi:hypothetical protein
MKVKMELILSTILALYAVLTFPTGYLLLTAIVSIAAFIFTESYFSVVGVLIVMSVLQLLKSTLLPTIESSRYGAAGGPAGSVKGAEGFQPRDPVSIHKRIEQGKKGGPLQPKVDGVQGVLEAPSILSSLQISNVDAGERGVSRQTLPAMVGSSEPIRTPAEGFVPNVPSPDNGAPRGNPYLHGGADDEAVGDALNPRATLSGVSGNVVGASSGPADV